MFLFVFYSNTIAGVISAMESNRIANSENSGVIGFGFGEDDSVVVRKVDGFKVDLFGERLNDEKAAARAGAGVGVESSEKVGETVVAPLTVCTVQKAPTEDPFTKKVSNTISSVRWYREKFVNIIANTQKVARKNDTICSRDCINTCWGLSI